MASAPWWGPSPPSRRRRGRPRCTAAPRRARGSPRARAGSPAAGRAAGARYRRTPPRRRTRCATPWSPGRGRPGSGSGPGVAARSRRATSTSRPRRMPWLRPVGEVADQVDAVARRRGSAAGRGRAGGEHPGQPVERPVEAGSAEVCGSTTCIASTSPIGSSEGAATSSLRSSSTTAQPQRGGRPPQPEVVGRLARAWSTGHLGSTTIDSGFGWARTVRSCSTVTVSSLT